MYFTVLAYGERTGPCGNCNVPTIDFMDTCHPALLRNGSSASAGTWDADECLARKLY